MRSLPVVSLGVCLLAACGGDDPLPTGEISGRVTHYDYSFDLDTRAAHAVVRYAVTTGGDCLTLPMRASLMGTPTIDGEPVNATTTADTVTFCGVGYRTGTTIELGADITFPLAVLGTSQVGYSITKDSAQNPFYYLVSWVGGCDRFGPCDNRPDQFATYTFTVTHPAGYKARCPGTITDLSDTQTKCDFTYDGAPTYSTFGVAAYPAWTETDKGTWGGVKVTLYDRSTTLINAAIDPAYHDGFVQWMIGQFGAYPYGDELRVLTAPTYWGGFEHPGNIVLDDGLAKLTRPSYFNESAHTLDHEIAHMWAGNQTTLADTYDFVWKEAMAEYLPYVYEASKNAAWGTQTAGAWKAFSVAAKYFPVPQDQPTLFDYYGDVYGPGPMILFRQLEVLTSREQVLAAIQAVLGSPHALSVDTLLGKLAETTGLDLTSYANAWLRGSGTPSWPKYNVTFTPGAGTSSLALVQVNKAALPRGCRFHVALRGAGTGEEQLVDVNTFTGGEDQTLQVPTPAFTVTTVVLDPAAECLVYAMTTSPRTSRPYRVTSPWSEAASHPWQRR